ncbi:hypothetical protein ACOMHN_001457 [Nucella lapillus]
MNGMHRPPPEMHQQQSDKKRRNYKLIVDPTIHSYKGNQKVYRFEGINPDGRVIDARDPRPRYQRIWCRRQPADLPVPQFKYDHHYVGTPPPKEVTFTNLNDNINKDFLENMCKGFGTIEESRIYYHPKTKKHLGIGKVRKVSTLTALWKVSALTARADFGRRFPHSLLWQILVEGFHTHRSVEGFHSHRSLGGFRTHCSVEGFLTHCSVEGFRAHCSVEGVAYILQETAYSKKTAALQNNSHTIQIK